jgi:hypothetical protein
MSNKPNTFSDKFFIDNPDKILGDMSISDYMNKIIVKGKKEDVLKKFEAKESKSEVRQKALVESITDTVPDKHYSEQIIDELALNYGWKKLTPLMAEKNIGGNTTGGTLNKSGNKIVYATFDVERNRYLALVSGWDNIFDIDCRGLDVYEVAKEFNEKVDIWNGKGRLQEKEIRGSNENTKQDEIADLIRANTSTARTEQQRQEIEKKIVYDYAKKNNIWFDSLYDLGNPISGGGNENTLAYNVNEGFIYKSNNLSNYKYSILGLLDSIKFHNEIFGCAKYILVGFTGLESFIEPIFKQKYIQGAEQATYEDIESLMNILGFKKINEHSFKNEKYIVSDLSPRNVLKDEDGNICVIDDIIKLSSMDADNNKKEMKPAIKEKTKEVLSIEDNIKKYTPHLSDSDIKAFVWYNRTMGIPMTGWEKWFIKSTKKVLAVATEDIDYLNNKWQVIGNFVAGQEVGKATRFEHTYNGITYISIRSIDGSIILVDKSKLDIANQEKEFDKNELDLLVKDKSLLYLNGAYVPLHVYTNTDYQILRDSLNKDKVYIIEKYGEDIYNYHESLLTSYNSFRIDEPNKDKRFKLNPFGDIARNFEIYIDDIPTNLTDAFISHCRGLKQSDFELVSKTEFTNIVIYDHSSARRGSSDEEKEENKVRVNSAYLEAERLFSEFMYNSLEKEYQVKLNVIINETYNRTIIVRDDKIPVGFISSYLFNNTPFSLKPVQVEAFKYAVARNSYCLALTVGFGKSSLGISLLSYMVSSGVALRPLVIVPKPVLKNWMKEMNGYWSDNKNNIYFHEKEGLKRHYGILSGTGIQVSFLSNLNAKYQKVLEKNPIKDNTITLVSYEALEKIYIKDNKERGEIIKNWKLILEQTVEGKKETERQSTQKLLSLIESLNKVDKDAVIPIDNTKIDFIMVDEAHRLKNMFVGVNADSSSRIKSGFKGASSNRALRAFYLSQYMHKNYKGRMAFLTATPFSNTPLEVFTMMCFLGWSELVKNNVHKIQSFVEMFFNETFDYTVDSKNRIVAQSVMKKYKNKRILYKLLNNVFLYRNDPEQAGITRPCIIRYPNKDQKIILKMSDLQMIQRGYLAEDRKIIAKIEAEIIDNEVLDLYYQSFQGKLKDMQSGKSDIGLAGSILACSRISSLSPFAESPVMMDFITAERWREVYEYSPKIKFTIDCIKSMIEYHISRGEKNSLFVIYTAMGVNILPYIKQALEEVVGFKKNVLRESDEDEGVTNIDEVEIISGSVASDKEINRRELVQNLFNEGTVKVIIGTATIKEGVNLQKNSATLFNLTPDWNSTDVEQMEGRIHRQGNRFGYARIITPLVIGTLDSFIYQKYEEKKARLKDIWEDDGQMISEDLNIEIPAEKQKELILSDEDQIAKIRVGMLKKNIINQENKINDDINLLISSKHTINEYNKYFTNSIDQLGNLLETVNMNIETLKFLKEADDLPKYIKKDRVNTLLEYYAEFKENVELANKTREGKDIVNILSPSFMRRTLSFELIYDDKIDFERYLSSNRFKNASNMVNREIAIYPYKVALLYVDDYGGNTSNFRKLKDTFTSARLVERDILLPNNLNLLSPIEELDKIGDTFRQKRAELRSYSSTIFDENGKVLESYWENMKAEIKSRLDKENNMALNPDQMVEEFTERTNIQLSYLKDEVDLKNCPIPKVECCPTNGEYNVEVQTIIEKPEVAEPVKKIYVDEKYLKLYKEIKKVLPDLERLPDLFYSKSGAKGEPIMPLSVERQILYSGQNLLDKEGFKLVMEQNYVQEGDLMTDPRIDYAIYPELKAAIPLNYEVNGMGIYQELVEDKKITSEKNFNNVIKFSHTWLKNLVEQDRIITLLSRKIEILKEILRGMESYNYNKPISIEDIRIIFKEQKDKPYFSRILKFEWNGSFYSYKYTAGSSSGSIVIDKFKSEDGMLKHLSKVGEGEVIYNTWNSNNTTEEGTFVEYSISKWIKNIFN